MTRAPKVWGDALRLLQDEIPDFAYEAWIAPLAVKVAGARVVLGCPTSFHRERVRIQMSAPLEQCWSRACAANPCGASDAEACSDAPCVALVDMKEFAAAAGTPVEAPIRLRRAESLRRVEPALGIRAAVGDVRPGALERTVAQRSAPPCTLARGANEHDVARAGGRSDAQSAAPKQDVLRVETRPRLSLDAEPAQGELPFSFESFVVGPCNALAREAALALARRRQSHLNQLYLGGESGLGKTHLARAAAAEARRHDGLATVGTQGMPSTRALAGYGHAASLRAASAGRGGIVYTTAEQFTSDFVSALRKGRSEDFERRYRGPIGMLIVEDVQFFDGRVKTQLELFHTVQHVLDAGGRVLLTGDRAPRELKGLSDRMREQLTRGFVAELERPDAIVRRHILRAKAAAGGVHLPADCLDLLVEATGGSVRDIESVLIQVVTTASLLGRSIDLALTREAIERKAGGSSPLAPRRVEVGEIIRIVAAFFGRRPEALVARSRRRDVLVPRQLAMYLAHRYTNASFAEIGRSLGRDHPSVRNAITRIERQVLESAPLRYQVEALSERLDQALAKSAGRSKTGPVRPEASGLGDAG